MAMLNNQRVHFFFVRLPAGNHVFPLFQQPKGRDRRPQSNLRRRLCQKSLNGETTFGAPKVRQSEL